MIAGFLWFRFSNNKLSKLGWYWPYQINKRECVMEVNNLYNSKQLPMYLQKHLNEYSTQLISYIRNNYGSCEKPFPRSFCSVLQIYTGHKASSWPSPLPVRAGFKHYIHHSLGRAHHHGQTSSATNAFRITLWFNVLTKFRDEIKLA